VPWDYAEVKRIFLEAAERSGADQSRYLDETCAGDPALRAEVEALLAADAGPARAFDQPVSISGFTILRRIGEGGMGTVYEAQQVSPRRAVALKLLKRGLSDPERVRRFRHETEILGRLDHPGIARIYAAGVEDGQPWFAMELVRGKPLLEHARDLGPRDLLALVGRICDAVDHAHKKGIVHRDLKPGNILVDAQGEPRLLDFGVAKAFGPDDTMTTLATRAGEILGTVPYMSPEQVRGNPDAVDERADVYALGGIAYELLTGRLPLDLEKKPFTEALRTVLEQEPRNLGALDPRWKGDVETIVAKALAKDPERRYGSAGEMGADIGRFLKHEPIQARPPSTIYQLRKFARRHRPLVLASGAVLVALAVAVVAVLRAGGEDPAEAYRLAVVGAAAALASYDVQTAERLLDEAPPDQRGWEWDHLRAVFDAKSLHAGLGGTIVGSGWTQDGAALAVTVSGDVFRWTPGAGEPARICRLDSTGLIAGGVGTGRAFPTHDGSRILAFNDQPRNVRLWDARTGKLIRVFRHYRSYAMAESGDAAAEAGGDRLYIERCDASGEWKETANADFQGHTRRVLAFSPDGSYLLVGTSSFSRGHLAVFDTRTGERLFATEGPAFPVSAAWTRDNARFVVGDNRGAITVWTRGGESGTTLMAPVSQRVAVSGSGELVAAAAGPTVLLLSLERAEVVRVLPHPAAVTDVAFSDDDTRLLTAAGPELHVWDATAGEGTVFAHNWGVLDVDFTADGRRALSCGSDGTVRIWSTADERCLAVLGGEQEESFLDGVFTPDGRFVVGSDTAKGIKVWSADTGERLRAWTADVVAHPLCLAGDAVVGAGSAWSVPEGVRGQAVPGNVVAVSPDGRLLACAEDGNASIRTTTGGREVARLPGDRALEAAFSPDGRALAFSYADGTVRLFDAAAGRQRATLEGHTGEVQALAFAPDGTRLATGGEDGVAILWSVPQGQELLRLRHAERVRGVAFSPDGRTLLTGCRDGTIRFWHARPLSERRAAAARWQALRQAQRPSVEALLAEAGAERAAATLRSDAARSPDERAAALDVLMMLAANR